MGTLKNMGLVFGIGAILITIIALILFVCWCAVKAVSIISGQDFITSIVLIIGLLLLVGIFSRQLRGRPIVAMNVGNKYKCKC